MKLTKIFVELLMAFLLVSCQSNEEKIIKEYLTTIENADGSTTKIEIGKYNFNSFEEIPVNGKFVYSLGNDNEETNKDSVMSLIKENLREKNMYSLFSAISFIRSLNCSDYEWEKKLDYKERSEKNSEESLDAWGRAYDLGKIYNSFDSIAFYMIKSSYDYKLESIESKNIVKYFVYNKQENKIIKSFDALNEEFVQYYYKSVEAIDLQQYDDINYDYKELLDKPLEELIGLLDNFKTK